jgi:hypothetical protein
VAPGVAAAAVALGFGGALGAAALQPVNVRSAVTASAVNVLVLAMLKEPSSFFLCRDRIVGAKISCA